MALTHSPTIRTNAGFTYIGLLIVVAIMGVTLAGVATVWQAAQQRVKEQRLLFIGNQFSFAINAYYQNSPEGVKQFPKKLEDLLLDKRYPNTTRYLRKIFTDPFTGDTQWGLIKGADGGIIGVHSLSQLAPIKMENFGRGNEGFSGKKHYSEWKFNYRPNSNLSLAAAAMPGNLISDNPTPTNPAPADPPPGNANPPAYQVPPPEILPADPSDDQRKKRLCQIMRSNDANTCALLASKFGAAAGAACMASATQRYTLCTSGDHVALPPLAVQYK